MCGLTTKPQAPFHQTRKLHFESLTMRLVNKSQASHRQVRPGGTSNHCAKTREQEGEVVLKNFKRSNTI